jgi:hypothetical protein
MTSNWSTVKRKVDDYKEHAKACRALAARTIQPDDKVILEEIDEGGVIGIEIDHGVGFFQELFRAFSSNVNALSLNKLTLHLPN